MSDGQTLQRQVRGLRTARNKLTLQEGSQLYAQNATLDRSDIISSRRGFSRHGVQQASRFARLFEYRHTLLGLTGQTLKYYDASAGWTAWTGTYDPPSGHPMRGLEIDEKFIFTTSNGPFVQETLTGTPRRAGIPGGLDLQAELIGPGGQWFLVGTNVGHRIVWGKDELPPGAPSQFVQSTNVISGSKIFANLDFTSSTPTIRVTYSAHGFSSGDEVVIQQNGSFGIVDGSYTISVVDSANFTFTNPGLASIIGAVFVGKEYGVRLTSTIPQGVEAGWWWEAYRSSLSPDLATDPLDDGQKVTRQTVTSTDISNGYVQWTDTVDDELRGVQLYTNEGTAEGLDLSNDRPPFAAHIAHFRGHVMYLGGRREHYRQLDLKDTDLITDGTGSLTISAGGSSWTYTAAATEDVALKQFKLHTEAVEGTMAVAVRKTAGSLCKVVNRDSTCAVYATYISGQADDAGKILFRRRDLLDISFSITRSSGVAVGAFDPDPPTSGTSLSSANDSFSNRVAKAKFQKPEAVPTLNTESVGRLGFEFLGAVTLKDSLLLCKEDGVFEITGETDGLAGDNFVVREIDPELILIAPETLVALDNVAFGWFNSGVMRVSSSQSAILSDDMIDLLQDATRWSNFTSTAFAVAYPSDQKYLLWIAETGSAATAELGYVFDFLENAWMGPWKRDVSCGIVLKEDDRLYMGHGVDNYALRERKDYTEDDFIDEEIAVTVTAFGTATLNGATVATATISYSYSANIEEGWLFQQDIYRAGVELVSDLGGGSFLLTLSSNITVATGAANLALPIDMLIHWADDVASNVAQQKDYVEAQIYMEDSQALHHYVGFVSDEIGTETWLPRITHVQAGGWGSSWGTIWGDPRPNFSTPVRAPIPRDHKRARALRTLYRHRWAREPVNILQMAMLVNNISEMTTLAPR